MGLQKEQKKPSQVTARSASRVWWICKEGHSWNAIIYSRTGGDGCPKCGLIKIGEFFSNPTDKNRLSIFYPELVKQWDYKKNTKEPEE